MPLKFDRYLDIAKALLHQNDSYNKHFSFIIQKNRIMSIGLNSLKTHPEAAARGFKYPHQHSELSAIIRYPERIRDLSKCILVNVRLNKDGVAMISCPCKNCKTMIKYFGFKQVFYTNKEGEFEQL